METAMARTGEVVTNDTVKSLRQPAKKNYTFFFGLFWLYFCFCLFVCLFVFIEVPATHITPWKKAVTDSVSVRLFIFSVQWPELLNGPLLLENRLVCCYCFVLFCCCLFLSLLFRLFLVNREPAHGRDRACSTAIHTLSMGAAHNVSYPATQESLAARQLRGYRTKTRLRSEMADVRNWPTLW